MQFAVLTRRKTEQFPDEQFALLAEAEGEQAKALYAGGFIRQLWMRGDMPGAFMLVEADNEEEARAKLRTLPMNNAGMLDLVALVPLKPYRAFCPTPKK